MAQETNGNEPRGSPRLNERILSSMSKRTVAAHPWHDLEIGKKIREHLILLCLYLHLLNYEVRNWCCCKNKCCLQDLELPQSSTLYVFLHLSNCLFPCKKCGICFSTAYLAHKHMLKFCKNNDFLCQTFTLATFSKLKFRITVPDIWEVIKL